MIGPPESCANADNTPGAAWMGEHYATVVRMVIETMTQMKHVPLEIDYAQPETRVLSRMRKPLPQMRMRLRYRGQRIMISRSTGANQVMATSIDVLEFGRMRVSTVFYGGRALHDRPRRFTNMLTFLHVAVGHAIHIGRLHDAITERRCPGLQLKRCRQPRSPTSYILYVRCAQNGGAKKRRQVTIIVEERSVMLIGICDLRFVDYTGAVRRLLAASGAMAGPHARVDHREAFWPSVGARDTPGIDGALAYMAAHTVAD